MQEPKGVWRSGVGRKGAPRRLRFRTALIGIARIVVRPVTGNVDTEPERGRWAGLEATATGGIFPFRFREEPVARPGLPRQPLDVGFGILPADVDHWLAFVSPTVV